MTPIAVAPAWVVASLLLVGPPLHGGVGAGAPVSQESDTSPAAAFAAALESFRLGTTADPSALRAAAEALTRELGRDDPSAVASYYEALDARERRRGIELEEELDRLLADLVEAVDHGGDQPAAREALRRFHARSSTAADLVPAAHAAAWLARLAVRDLERTGRRGAPETHGARELADDALRRFQAAGQTTPTADVHWTRARLALVTGDLAGAERSFRRTATVARRAGLDEYRERGLLGLIGVARARGAVLEIDRLLDQLATFRDPAVCWALTREAAVQMLSRDECAAAQAWLASRPPSLLDPELASVGAATVDWRALLVAAAIRSGDLDTAAAELEELPPDDALPLRAALDLARGDFEGALAAVSLAPPERGDSIDLESLRGQALLGSGRLEEAVEVLTRALRTARLRQIESGPRSGGVSGSSAVAEWLGLSAVEALARAHLMREEPLEAAAAIELAHLPAADPCTDPTALGPRLQALASATTAGVVTWVAAADRSIAVHVTPSGQAHAMTIDLPRRAIVRAARRLREAAYGTRQDAGRALDTRMGEEVAGALLPPTFIAALRPGKRPSSAVLLAHGVLEQIPFECLPGPASDPERGTLNGAVALGLSCELVVSTALRRTEDLAPTLDASRARWTAIGAPDPGAGSHGFADLAGARREIESLEALHPRLSGLVGSAATVEALAAALTGSGPLHVATHATERRDGLRSTRGLVLAGGEILSVEDIAGLAPRLPLLVLTTCGSADGALLDGVGMRGIAQAALESGTRMAIVTQWSIEDEHARVLALALHGALLDGASPPEGLRRGRVALHRSGAPAAEWGAFRALGSR